MLAGAPDPDAPELGAALELSLEDSDDADVSPELDDPWLLSLPDEADVIGAALLLGAAAELDPLPLSLLPHAARTRHPARARTMLARRRITL